MYVVVDTYIHEIVRYIDVHVRDTFTLTGDWTRDVGGGEERPPPHPTSYLVGRHVMYLGRFDSEVFLFFVFCFSFLASETCEFAL